MNTAHFKFTECFLVKRSLDILKRDLPEESQIAAVLNFDDNYVLERKHDALDGVCVITGPILGFHIFINRGMTRKYIGELVDFNGTLIHPNVTGYKLQELVDGSSFTNLLVDINGMRKEIGAFLSPLKEATS